MRVVHITSAHPADDSRIFCKECSCLVHAGYEVFLVSQGIAPKNTAGVRFITLKTRQRFNRLMFTGLEILARSVSLNAKMYHFHDPELMWVGIVLKCFGFCVIYDVHEDLPAQVMNKDWIKPFLRKWISCVCSKIEHFLSRFFDAIVTATPHIAHRFLGRNVVCVRNVPELSEFSVARPPKTKHFQVVYVGGISEIRGVFDCINAFQEFAKDRNVRFVIAGPPSSLSDKMRILKSVESDHRIIWHPWLNRQAVVNLLYESTIGVVMLHPIKNYVDSYPVKFFEYMAAGLPFLASDFPVWRELAEGFESGLFVCPKNIDAIRNAMEWAFVNSECLDKMSKNGMRVVHARYSWNSEKDVLIKLYDSLLLN